MKADLESEVAKAAIKLRNTFIAAETMIGRELSFLIFVLFPGFKEIFIFKKIQWSVQKYWYLHHPKENL